MKESPLTRLLQCGQSLWLDRLSRSMLISGELVALFQQDGVSGVTSNPALFERSVAAGADYDDAIAALARQGLSAAQIHETLVTENVRMAADLLLPLYERLEGRDGLVSVELSPHLAHDSAGTLREARRLWELMDRPNLLIAVPATREGVVALRQLVREGISVNATLLFGVPRYRAVAEAYLDALSERAARGLSLAQVTSVASVLLGRIDAMVDPLLARLARQGGGRGRLAAALKGQVAIACAKAVRTVHRELVSDARYRALSARGARRQRLVWTVIGVRDPSCSDLKYPEALIGPDTVANMPLDTLAAYRDHGMPACRLDEGLSEALEDLEQLFGLDIDLNRLSRQLEDEGVERFVRQYDSLMRNIELKRSAAVGQPAGATQAPVPG